MFSDWFRGREKKLQLVEGTDFVTLRTDTGYVSESGRQMIEFVVTIKTAKQFASIQSAGRGKALLQYLTNYEQKGPQEPLTEPDEVALPTLSFDAPSATVEALPATPPANEPATTLTPAQQLLQQAQKLVEQEQANQSGNPQHGERLAAVEGKLDLLAKLFQSAAAVLTGTAITEEIASPVRRPETTRTKLTRMVDSYVMATGKTYKQVWRSLYGALHLTSHFDALAVADSDKESYLDGVEKHGYMDTMYNLASQRLTMGHA